MGRHGENIRKRKDGRWEGRYKMFAQNKCRNIYRSVYGSTYEEVKGKLSKYRCGFVYEEGGKKDGENAEKAVVFFSQAAEEWLEKIADKRKHSTYVKYNTVYQTHLAGIIGSCLLSAAAAQEIQIKIFDHLSEGAWSESLQKSICCITNQILDYANKKYLSGIPLIKGLPVKPAKKITWTLSKAEQARLLGCVRRETDKFKTAVLLCLYTGLRLGELCALQWSDIDFAGMTLTVNRTVQRIAVCGHRTRTILLETDPKSDSSRRTIPLTVEMAELLMGIKRGQPYVFGNEKPLDPRTMQYRFKKILKEAGIESKNFHLLRHTFATNCIENSIDVKALSEILGHSDVKITLNRYVHPTMDLKRRQIGTLPDFYGRICGQICGQAA